MKYILHMSVVSLLAGLVGGVIGARLANNRKQANPSQLVRARAFELIDEGGKVVSYWGVDKGNNIVLAFAGGPSGQATAPGATSATPSLGLKDPHNQAIAIGVVDRGGFVSLRGADGTVLIHMNIGLFEKPLLWMADQVGPRVALGVEQSDTPGPQDNNWSLRFQPEAAWIGIFPENVGGQTHWRGGMRIQKDRVNDP